MDEIWSRVEQHMVEHMLHFAWLVRKSPCLPFSCPSGFLEVQQRLMSLLFSMPILILQAD